MGFWDITFLIALIVLAVVFCWFIVEIVIGMKRKKEYESVGIKIVKDCKDDKAWFLISACNMIVQFSDYISKNKPMYLFGFLIWLIILIASILFIITKVCYITAEGVFISSERKIRLNEKYKYRYRITEDSLELFDEKTGTRLGFRIVENREDLMRMLDENYVPYMD